MNLDRINVKTFSKLSRFVRVRRTRNDLKLEARRRTERQSAIGNGSSWAWHVSRYESITRDAISNRLAIVRNRNEKLQNGTRSRLNRQADQLIGAISLPVLLTVSNAELVLVELRLKRKSGETIRDCSREMSFLAGPTRELAIIVANLGETGSTNTNGTRTSGLTNDRKHQYAWEEGN